MKRIATSVMALACAVLGLSAAPSNAAPSVPTVYQVFSRGITPTTYNLAVQLYSADQRCMYGRTVKLQELTPSGWQTRKQDTTKYTEVAGMIFTATSLETRFEIPAKTLSDGTVCAAGKSLDIPVASREGKRFHPKARSTAKIASGLAVDIATIDPTFSRLVIAGEVLEPNPCKKERTVRFQVLNSGSWIGLGKDVTGASGAFGIGGPALPGSAYRVLAKAKTLPNGTTCPALNAPIS